MDADTRKLHRQQQRVRDALALATEPIPPWVARTCLDVLDGLLIDGPEGDALMADLRSLVAY